MQETEHDPEERVHRRLVGKDTRVRQERRPRAASPIGMDTIDQRHRRPQDEILKLRDDKTLPPAATAHPAEDRSEECAVREMRSDADPTPGGVGGEQGAEEAHD
jgi:hypothetical protein